MDRTITLFNLLTLAVASAALLFSIWSHWLSQFRQGRILFTQPTIFFFGWDDHRGTHIPKIMFRSALFSTGSRGQVVENLFAVVKTEHGEFEFPFWGYDDGKGMVRGSGVYVGPTGYVAYHHFNPINDEHVFSYSGINYEVELYAKLFGRKKIFLLGRYKLQLSDATISDNLAHADGGVLLSWSPKEGRFYHEYSPRPFDWAPIIEKVLSPRD